MSICESASMRLMKEFWIFDGFRAVLLQEQVVNSRKEYPVNVYSKFLYFEFENKNEFCCLRFVIEFFQKVGWSVSIIYDSSSVKIIYQIVISILQRIYRLVENCLWMNHRLKQKIKSLADNVEKYKIRWNHLNIMLLTHRPHTDSWTEKLTNCGFKIAPFEF